MINKALFLTVFTKRMSLKKEKVRQFLWWAFLMFHVYKRISSALKRLCSRSPIFFFLSLISGIPCKSASI